MKDDRLLQNNPLSETDTILQEDFYGRPAARTAMTSQDKAQRPTHYKVICISLYNQDLAELETKVAELKRRGWTKANKSQLIRLALSQIDLDRLPPPPR
jgi:hypothetical protein